MSATNAEETYEWMGEEDEAKAAEERRKKRKRRLENLAATTSTPIEGSNTLALKNAKSTKATSSLSNTVAAATAKASPPEETANESDASLDMFGTSSEESTVEKKKPKTSTTTTAAAATTTASRQDGFDDSDGYYKAAIGETIQIEVLSGDETPDRCLKLRVLGMIGKGVFSSVLKCSASNEEGSSDLPPEVAIKCIRSNETMAKAALDEMKFLLRLKGSSGIVPLLLPTNAKTSALPPAIDFKGHTLLVFPYLPYNLRDVLQKFGKGVGLSLGAVQNYFRQLLQALLHLQKHGILHADLKPDNILVTSDFSTVLMADFGSALEATHETAEILTPYLVSRYYRAPEIILGLQPLTHGIDLWSLAVTMGELFLGKVLLTGANNNDMLFSMMTVLGPFSGRTIKSHLLQTKKHPMQAHFTQVQSTYVFRQETIDPVLQQAVHKEVSLVNTFQPTLQTRLLKAKSPKDNRNDVLKFADLLTKCLVLDPTKRIGVREALHHDFVGQPQKQ